jgi:hypothetical protein
MFATSIRHGDACQAECDQGYIGAPVFYCLDGQWTAPPGVPNTCTPLMTSCPYKELPPVSNAGSNEAEYEYWCGWRRDMEMVAAEGSVCKIYCDASDDAGYHGTLAVWCKDGNWTLEGSCSPYRVCRAET